MKVSLNLAQAFSNVDLKSIPRDELLRRIGAQLGAVEEVIDWTPKFEGAVIVRVVSCEKHPDADRLNVCRVDDGGQNQRVERGEDGLIQVVCGAPNVHAGMFAVWLAPGVTVPNSRSTDPFVLEAREIRGVVSNGMMASAHELGISEDHSGIVEVTTEDAGKEPIPGEPLINYFGLDDFVIDCENKMFTHRPDCFGNLGVARELAGISGLKFESPDWYRDEPLAQLSDSDLPFETIEVMQMPPLVPRFVVQVVEGVSVRPSPMSMQAVLARAGIKPINNIVDLSNYYMHLTAQPTHAFDYDKLKSLSSGDVKLFPRMAHEGEELTLLGGKTIKLTKDDLVIATDQKAVALAGIMGGAETEVNVSTKNILIEAATFDMYAIRRASMRHGLFTDAASRFNKGQSPEQNRRVLIKLVDDICAQTGAKRGTLRDSYAVPHRPEPSVTAAFVNSRLGSDLSAEDMSLLLENVEIGVRLESDTLHITPPFWRMDLEIAEDIVEEIGRLYGYDKLPVALPKRSAKPTAKNELFEFKQHLRFKLKEAGANEVLTYSFVHGDLQRKTNTDPERWAYHLRNALSPDLQYYRTSLVPSLLAKVHPNIKAQAGSTDNRFALFEIGRAHVTEQMTDGLPTQMERLALVVTADDKTAKHAQAGAAYYLGKKYLDWLTDGQAVYEPLTETDYPITAPYAPGRSATVAVGGEILGVIGEFAANVRSGLKLPEFTAGFELDIEALQKYLKPQAYEPLPAFPQTSQDITVDAESGKTYARAEAELAGVLEIAAAGHGYRWRIEPADIFAPEESEARKLTFRITLWHPDRTLTTAETNSLMQKLAGEA